MCYAWWYFDQVPVMGDKAKAPHHRGAHQVTARRLTQAGYANPAATCHYCKRTLDNCGPRGNGRNRNGTPCTWQACHVVDGDSRYGYVLGCSFCNQSEGARAGNAQRREPRSECWW